MSKIELLNEERQHWLEQAAEFERRLTKSEQESADLRLLLSAMCRGVVWIPLTGGVSVRLGPEATWFDCKLDSSGIPVLTPEIVEALKAAK